MTARLIAHHSHCSVSTGTVTFHQSQVRSTTSANDRPAHDCALPKHTTHPLKKCCLEIRLVVIIDSLPHFTNSSH